MAITIDDILNEPGLARVVEGLRSLIRPTIRLDFGLMNDGLLPNGTTKLGGSPDLLPDVDWPIAHLDIPAPTRGFVAAHSRDNLPPPDGIILLPFVAQIRLADVAPYDESGLLPRDGLLTFFYDNQAYATDTGPQQSIKDNQTGYRYGLYSAPFDGRVLYTPEHAISALVRRPAPEKVSPQACYPATALQRVYSQDTLPKVETSRIGEPNGTAGTLRLANDEWNMYAELHYELTADTPRYLMLGNWDNPQPYAMEGGYQHVREQFFAPETDWESLSPVQKQAEYDEVRLLFQLDSCENGMWFGRAGVLFFFIRERDLRARDFSKVWVRVQ